MEVEYSELKKQQEWYTSITEETSESLAYFYCCIKYDVPFDMNAVPRDEPKEKWIAYRDNLRIKRLDARKGVPLGFLDGLTDITSIFGERLSAGEFSRAIGNERSRRDIQPGTRAQRATWGTGGSKKPYTTEDYKRLDEVFNIYSSRLVSAGGYDAQQEHILRSCCRMSLDMEKCLAEGAYDKAQKLNKMIQDNLASENLRRKDEKPVEEVRIDSIVDALEKAGLVKQGKILALPDLQKKLLERLGTLGGKPSHKYPYTLDAADQMLQIIINTARANDGEAEITDFSDNMTFDENVAQEFAPEPNADENIAYENMGLVRHRGSKAVEEHA